MAKKNEDSDPKKSLELAYENLNRMFPGTILRFGDDYDTLSIRYTSTGALNLDLALGQGLPFGRVVEIFGPEAVGKSTLCTSIIAEAQKLNEICVYIDMEGAFDALYAQTIGVDLSNLILVQPNSGEEALEIASQFIKSGGVGVVVIDSVAALVPEAELEGSMKDQQVGAQARMMGKGLRKLTGPAHKTNTLVVFVNQLRFKIGVMFGNPETRPGGMALRFASSIQIDLRRVEDVKDDNGEVNGVKVKAKLAKNRMTGFKRQVEFDIMFGRGINQLGCLLDMAEKFNIVTKSGTWYSYGGEKTVAQGRKNAIEWLASDMAVADKIKQEVLNAANPSSFTINDDTDDGNLDD